MGERSPRRSMRRYDAVCIHTIVGYAPAHAAHFSVKADGTILQSRDTRYQSGANLDGNDRIIAIENEDHGSAFGYWDIHDGHAVPDFTPEQIEANARILAFAHTEHGVPLKLCPDSKSTSQGLAYHRQGIKGNWAGYRFGGWEPGGEIWTESPGKVCPGDRRIARRGEILERAREIVAGDSGGNMVWSEDLGRNTPGPKITELADETLPSGASRQASGLLGYAAAAFYYLRNRLVGRVWGRRWPWRGWIKDEWPDLQKAYPNGYTMQALLQNGFGYGRWLFRFFSSWDKLVNTLGKAIWSREYNGNQGTHGQRLYEIGEAVKRMEARQRTQDAVLATLVANDELTEARVRELFQEALEAHLVQVDVSVQAEEAGGTEPTNVDIDDGPEGESDTED